jgi:RND superfamily putative drug exporter
VIIRIFVLPALMALLGRWNWWPSRLGRAEPALARHRRSADLVASAGSYAGRRE